MDSKFSSSPNPRLLFTGGGGAASEALARLLAVNYDVHFCDADFSSKPASIAAERWHRIPYATTPEFVSAITSLCRQLNIDLLIPAVDEELLLCTNDVRSLGVDVLLPPSEFVSGHLDKLTSNKILKNKHIVSPKTVLYHDRSEVGFPCIVKPRTGRGSRDVAVVTSDYELTAHITVAKKRVEDFIIQEFVSGQEYTVTISADRTGNLQSVVPVLVELKRGITIRAYTTRNEQVISACSAIHATQPVAGCYNIQLIMTNTGSVCPFELNPRISTTSCLVFAAGIDFISNYLSKPAPVPNQFSKLQGFRDNVALRRSWRNEFIDT